MRLQIGRTFLNRTGSFLLIATGLLVLWSFAVPVSGLSSFVAKTPIDIWGFLFTSPDAAENRSYIFEGLTITLRDAAIGYAAGLGGATIVALLFALFPVVSITFTPITMVLRTFPLIALTPLIILIFGRGAFGLAAIGFIVVFFAALLTISFGLRSAAPGALNVVTAFGGGRWAQLRKVAIPAAIPSFFTAARIAIPQAISAALIAEWLITGTGAGAQLLQAAGTSKYLDLWSVATVFILASCLIYAFVSAIEELVLKNFSGPSIAG